MKTVRTKRFLPFIALASVLAMGACDDDPVGTDDHDHHHEPQRVEVRVAGTVLASATPVSATGELSVDAGEETGHLDVVFIDEDGDAIVFDDAEYSLAVEIASGAIAEWEFDEPGEFGGHLKGLSAGTTTAEFQLRHGDHADFRSADVTIVIN